MFQMLHCDDMQDLSGRSNNPIAIETQTDDMEILSPKTHTYSAGDFTSKKSIVTLHFGESKTSCLSHSKSTDNEHSNGNDSERTTVNKLINNKNANNQWKVELSRYKKELREYNDTTQHLEKKYRRINTELNEMQLKHDEFLAQRKSKTSKLQRNSSKDDDAESYNTTLDCTSRVSSAYSLKQKYTKEFAHDDSLKSPHATNRQEANSSGDNRNILAGANKANKKKQLSGSPYVSEYSAVRTRAPSSLILKNHRFRRRLIESNNTAEHITSESSTGLKNIYKALKNMIENQEIQAQKQHKSYKQIINDQSDINAIDVLQLQNMLSNLQAEQSKSHILIQQQQKCLHEYRNRCKEAQQLVQSQKKEINHLQHNNAKLESDFTVGIEQLRSKIDMKLREVCLLPKMIREEREKNERFNRDNKNLSDRLRALQHDAQQLRVKLEDISKRKAAALSRLRIAERDLKIFKNQNTALKNEKKRLLDELKKVKDQLGAVQNTNKRSLSRQRETFEKQRRELQKRIYELEVKLNRSQKSTSGIIQERDKVITELQSQLNTLVHNFEVSQKHIRVLRRHIYSMPNGGQNLPPAATTTNNNVRFTRS